MATGRKPGNFFVGNGSDEVLLLIAATYLNPGDNVLASTHTFFNYEFVSRVFDGEVRTVPTRDLRYDLPAFAAAADARTKLVFLCNPNNPTGLHFTHGELADFVRSMPREALIVVDEAYAEYVDAADFPDVGNFRGLKDKGALASPHDAAARVLAYLERKDFGTHPVADVRD